MHKEFKELGIEKIDRIFKNVPNDEKIMIDVKSMLNKDELVAKGYRFWRL